MLRAFSANATFLVKAHFYGFPFAAQLVNFYLKQFQSWLRTLGENRRGLLGVVLNQIYPSLLLNFLDSKLYWLYVLVHKP
jgi:hypothetical protein